MRLRLLLVLLVVSAVWQAFAIGGRVSALGEAKQVSHALLHWQSVAHHHHDDASVVKDGSSESMQHLAIDGVLNLSAIWFVLPDPRAVGGVLPPFVWDEPEPSAPDLAGLERPPKLAAA